MISWLFPPKKQRKAAVTGPQSSGLGRQEATRPVSRGGTPKGHPPGENNAQPANRKSERMARRELLYGVVREAMVRAGVLTSWYKFKVLSLDGHGRQFLVMVDLARAYGTETSRLAEIEAMIAQGAKSRYDIVVTAVYWRMNEHVAVGAPGELPQAQPPRASQSRPMPLVSQPAPLDSGPDTVVEVMPARTGGRFEPIQADEVAAFKRALAAGVANPAAVAVAATGATSGVAHGASAVAFDGAAKHGPQSYTLLTGFEDTELPDAELRAPALSGTQYGELR